MKWTAPAGAGALSGAAAVACRVRSSEVRQTRPHFFLMPERNGRAPVKERGTKGGFTKPIQVANKFAPRFGCKPAPGGFA